MRDISRVVLARDAAARLTAAACKGEFKLWNLAETVHAQAMTGLEALAAAKPALALCEGCPVRQACHQWAEIDKYTGLAAGETWIDGASRALTEPRTGRRPGRVAS